MKNPAVSGKVREQGVYAHPDLLRPTIGYSTLQWQCPEHLPPNQIVYFCTGLALRNIFFGAYWCIVYSCDHSGWFRRRAFCPISGAKITGFAPAQQKLPYKWGVFGGCFCIKGDV
jgi:hypothetical protein